MNFKENESATKLRGGYYTKQEIASFLLRWVDGIKPDSLLEPSAGDGSFFRALAELDSHTPKKVTGFEIHPGEAEKARAAAADARIPDVQIHARDFLGWAVKNLMSGPRFDAAVGNPPFIRYQYCDPNLQQNAQTIFEHFNLRFTKHTNAWVPFVVACIALLRPGGRLAMVVPAEILHILHAQSLRTHLADQCEGVLVFDPQELWFRDVLQGAVLLLAERKKAAEIPSLGVAIVQTQTGDFLRRDPIQFFRDAEFINGTTIQGKWTHALLTKRERGLLDCAEEHASVFRFGEVADADVGIVTGANKFFLTPDHVVEKYELGPWAHPMFGRSEHVPGVIYDKVVHSENRRAGRPANFIWFTEEQREDLPESVRVYLDLGEAQNLHRRYKCRIRTPWYSVPSVYATEVGMLKRSHHFPRLIFNELRAFTTDTAYRIRSKGPEAQRLVFSFVNSLTALSAELEGRHYGGGVLELVPSEIEKLLMPLADSGLVGLNKLDDLIRQNVTPEDVLEHQDSVVLSAAGLTSSEAGEVRDAWSRLRNRRQRKD